MPSVCHDGPTPPPPSLNSRSSILDPRSSIIQGATQLYDSIVRPLIIQHVMPGTSAAKRRAAASPSPASAAAAAVSAPPGFPIKQTGLTRGLPAVTVPALADLISPELSELRVRTRTRVGLAEKGGGGSVGVCFFFFVFAVGWTLLRWSVVEPFPPGGGGSLLDVVSADSVCARGALSFGF